MFRQFIRVIARAFYSAGLIIFFLIVGRGFTSKNASKENNRIIFYGLIKAKLSTNWKRATKQQRVKEEFGGKGVIKMLGRG